MFFTTCKNYTCTIRRYIKAYIRLPLFEAVNVRKSYISPQPQLPQHNRPIQYPFPSTPSSVTSPRWHAYSLTQADAGTVYIIAIKLIANQLCDLTLN